MRKLMATILEELRAEPGCEPGELCDAVSTTLGGVDPDDYTTAIEKLIRKGKIKVLLSAAEN